MEDTNKNNKAEAQQETQESEAYEKRTQYTKQQSLLYTVISVALFFLIYFAVKGITGTVNQPYFVYAYGEDINAERVSETFVMGGISSESGYAFENARLEKESDGYVFTVLFSGTGEPDSDDDSYESIAEDIILFEYGDADDDVRIEFYPYSENPYYAEYAYGEKYVDIEIPTREIYIFEWNGSIYIKYRQYGSSIPSEIKALFSGLGKEYKY